MITLSTTYSHDSNILYMRYTFSKRLLVILAILFPLYADSTPPPKAFQGVLDLRGWNFSLHGVVPLKGEWEFYWENHVHPDTFHTETPPQKSGFLKLPGLWNGYTINGKSVPGKGFATYRLRILLKDKPVHPLSLKLLTINTAYSLFVNGNRITGNGIPGYKQDNTVAQYLPHVASFIPTSDTLDMVLHVANFVDAKGGPWKTILLGNETTIQEKRERKIAFELFLLGSILIIAIHYLTLFLLRRNDKVSLYFSLFCFSIALRIVVIGERYFHHLFPQIPWEIMRRVEFWTMHFPVAAFCLYIYHLYKSEYAAIIIRSIIIVALAFAGLVLILPAPLFTSTALPFEILILIAATHVLFVVIRAIQHHREGALSILIGCIILFLTVINDILYDNSLVQTMRLVPCGLFFFLFSQAILLSMRSANAYTKIENLTTHLSEINIALKRFVPYEFLHFLERNNIVEIQLGDQVLKRMTILFSDVRSFTAISEKMTPQENFNFLNAYLEKISPAIVENKGFIDKYVGDAIMALFPNNTDDAIQAAIDMQTYVEDFNSQFTTGSKQPIMIGIGAHTGSLMLGTIGNEGRMETTVISDTVNVASRMENLTKWYGARIIISEEMLSASNNADAYHYRSLGTVQVKGKSTPVTIIELLDGLPSKEFDIKMETKDYFEAGISHFQLKDIKQAKKLFNTVLKQNDYDRAAQIFIKRCNQLIDSGIPEGWTGVEIIEYT